jgi:hypothetical protein
MFPRSNAHPATPAPHELPQSQIARPDPLRRFSLTPYATNLSVMGRCIRLETNSAAIFEHLQHLCSVYPTVSRDQPQFRWRLICEPNPPQTSLSLTRFAFSDAGLRFAEFEQRTFLAVDIEARQAVAFLTAELVRDKLRLTIPFLDTLFCMTAASLGFVSLFANCVEVDGKGILLLGPPRSGKTTASYLATKLGMRLHADEGVFLELNNDTLSAWSGFWPMVFRKDAQQFFPELQSLAQSFSYHDFAFYHLEKNRFQSPHANPVTPLCSVFLNREASSGVHVSPMTSSQLCDRLSQSLLFDEDEQFHPQQTAALNLLSKVPGYEISYGSDPAAVVPELDRLHRALT